MLTQKMTSILALFALLVIARGRTNAFWIPYGGRTRIQHAPFPRFAKAEPGAPLTLLGMVPRYDTTSQTWFVVNEEKEGPAAGYGIIGSLYRAGPVPFIQRIINADSYEQAVLKYMAQEGVDRIEAQGNMDAYLENPADWQYQKMCEKNKGAPKKDYANANMNPKQILLSSMWAGVVFFFAYDLITGVADGRYGKADGTDLLHGNLWNFDFLREKNSRLGI